MRKDGCVNRIAGFSRHAGTVLALDIMQRQRSTVMMFDQPILLFEFECINLHQAIVCLFQMRQIWMGDVWTEDAHLLASGFELEIKARSP